MHKFILVLLLLCLPSISKANWGKQLINAVENSDYYRLQKQKLSTAQSERDAFSQPFYNPEIQAEYKNASENEYSVGVSKTLDFSNKLKFRKQYGEVRLLRAQILAQEVEQNLLFQAFNSLIALRQQQQLKVINNQQLILLEKLSTDVSTKEQLGEISKIDGQLAQISLANFLSQTSEQEVDFEIAKSQVKAWFNTELSLPDSLPVELNSRLSRPNIKNLALQVPKIKLAESQVNLLKADWKRVVAENKSDPTVGISAGKEGASNSVGITFSMPIAISNNYSSENSAKRSAFIEQEYQLAIDRKLMFIELEQQFNAYSRLFDSYKNWQSVASKNLSDTESLMLTLWQEGEINTSEFLLINQQRLEAARSGIELQSRLYKQYVLWLYTSNQLRNWLAIR